MMRELIPFAAVDEVFAAVCQQVFLLFRGAVLLHGGRAAPLARVNIQPVLTWNMECSIFSVQGTFILVSI